MRTTGFVLILLLYACRAEPDFDERFDRANRAIASTAAGIDADLAGGWEQGVQAAPSGSVR